MRERLTLRAAWRAPAGEIHLSDVIARAERRPHLRAVGALIATVMDKASPASAGRPTH